MDNSNTPFIELGVSAQQESFHIGDTPSLARPVLDLSYKVADHEGQLKTFSAAISAVQSALSSWVTVVIGFGAILIAAFAIITALEIFNGQKIDSKSSELSSKIDLSNQRIDQLSQDVNLLPSALSREMIGVAGAISTIIRPVPLSPPLPPERRP